MSRLGPRWLRGLAIVLSIVTPVTAAAPRAAFAGAREIRLAQKQDEREVRARELFGFGKYAEALALYGRLYAETAHPTYLRNMGRCYQNLGEPDKAINSFREYLRQVKSVSPEQRAVVEGYIHEMEELKQKREEASRPPPTTAQGEPEPEPARRMAAPSGGEGAEPAPMVDSHSHSRADADSGAASADGSRRTAAFVVGGAGLVALGVGGYFGLRSFSSESDGKNLCSMDPCSHAAIDDYNRAATSARIADVAIGVGLIGAGVATYLFLTSSGSEKGARGNVARRARLLPELGPDRAGLMAWGSW